MQASYWLNLLDSDWLNRKALLQTGLLPSCTRVQLQCYSCLTFLCCVPSNVLSNYLLEKLHSHIGCIFCLFTYERFQTSPQMACLRVCIVALETFLEPFSTVRFQTSPQMACQRGCIVTLIVFVLLFSSLRFQLFPRIGCIVACILTLVAFVCFFLCCVFSNMY